MGNSFEPIPRALCETVCSMTGTEPTILGGEGGALELTVKIRLGGQPGVVVWLSAAAESISSIYEHAMGMACEDPQEIVDFLGELANQTLGPAAIELEGADPHSLSLPEVVEDWLPTQAWILSGDGYEIALGASEVLSVVEV